MQNDVHKSCSTSGMGRASVGKRISKSTKLADVCYEIRGPVMEEAKRLEDLGQEILKLNIGNPAPFGFNAPERLLDSMVHNLHASQGYADSKGLYAARNAVQQECGRVGIPVASINDIFLGNGVSELIVMAMQGLLNEGDEVLIPSPDYPLWSAAVRLAGGIPVHYRCDEGAAWFPDIADIRRKTNRRTVALVVINPNNPTGAVYDRSLLKSMLTWARQNELIVLADEIYSKIRYDDAQYIPCASLDDEVLVLTFDGLSKAYRAAGFRSGWMVLTGPIDRASDYIEGLNTLASMRLCANVPAQHAVPVALSGVQDIFDMTENGGVLFEQRELAFQLLTEIPGISCVKPRGALYMFPKIDVSRFRIYDDERFVLDLLREKRIMVVHGTGFSFNEPNHFRLVFLPSAPVLRVALSKLAEFLQGYRQH